MKKNDILRIYNFILSLILLKIILHKSASVKAKKHKRCDSKIGEFLKSLGENSCTLKINLVSGSNCCQFTGTFCGLSKNNTVVILVNPETKIKYYIPVNKIATIEEKCQNF